MRKIFLKTFGCTLNKKDSLEVISNNKFTDDLKDIKAADIVLINTCGVKEQTQTKIINFLKKIKNLNIDPKKIIVFGCLVDIDKSSLKEVFLNAKYYSVSEKNKLKNDLKLKKINKKEFTKIIIISSGCLGNCNYCAVKFARGKLKSKNIDEIVNEIKKEVIYNAAGEIFLTSQDTACYGFDKNKTIIDLLKEILKIKKDFKIRLGMGNPQYIKPILKNLIKIYKNKKMYKFLHIPIQSGDNAVLKDMNRGYKIEDVYKIVSLFRKEIKNITIATDVIVGYPTENQNAFNNTLKAIKKIKPDIINISRFGKRKNIKANLLKDLKGEVKKNRSKKITHLFEKIAFENNKKFLNKIKEIRITEKGKNKTMVGRTNEYKPVVIFKNKKIGDKLKVKIKECKANYLISN